eukprot:scaffold23850_cov99-Isochrysis_galbana.AAC.1
MTGRASGSKGLSTKRDSPSGPNTTPEMRYLWLDSPSTTGMALSITAQDQSSSSPGNVGENSGTGEASGTGEPPGTGESLSAGGEGGREGGGGTASGASGTTTESPRLRYTLHALRVSLTSPNTSGSATAAHSTGLKGKSTKSRGPSPSPSSGQTPVMR